MSAKARYDHLMALYRAGQFDAAAKGVGTVLKASPSDPYFLHLAGLIAEAMGEVPRAIMFMRRALNVRPGWIDAHYNLARLLADQRDYREAIALMERVALAQPQMPQAFEALADFATRAGEIPAAVAYWKKALALVPGQREWRGKKVLLARQICAWDEEAEDIAKLPPQAAVVLSDDPAVQKQAAAETARTRFEGIEPLPPAAYGPHAKLRIGYLSSDFHAHATSYLLAELFSLHDKERFEIYAYSYGQDDGSEIRERLKKEVQHFVDIRKIAPDAAARIIRGDQIDVLVDLKGYTRGSRLEILARRPAPHQIHWLGYPGTLALPFIEGFVADAVTVPAFLESGFTEKTHRLPHCYQINDRQRPVGTALARRDYGLPEEAFVLGCFNQTYKITPEIFDIWCGILKERRDVVLWLYESNPYAPERLRHEAEKRGVDPWRLVFADEQTQDRHLARYQVMDLAIDTFPCGGHTTTSDALWAGTPVVTMAGKSFVSRVAASLLTAAGLAELITPTPEAYRALILSLMENRARLRQLRRHLVANRDTLPLFDTPRFVRDWEYLLQQINRT